MRDEEEEKGERVGMRICNETWSWNGKFQFEIFGEIHQF